MPLISLLILLAAGRWLENPTTPSSGPEKTGKKGPKGPKPTPTEQAQNFSTPNVQEPARATDAAEGGPGTAASTNAQSVNSPMVEAMNPDAKLFTPKTEKPTVPGSGEPVVTGVEEHKNDEDAEVNAFASGEKIDSGRTETVVPKGRNDYDGKWLIASTAATESNFTGTYGDKAYYQALEKIANMKPDIPQIEDLSKSTITSRIQRILIERFVDPIARISHRVFVSELLHETLEESSTLRLGADVPRRQASGSQQCNNEGYNLSCLGFAAALVPTANNSAEQSEIIKSTHDEWSKPWSKPESAAQAIYVYNAKSSGGMRAIKDYSEQASIPLSDRRTPEGWPDQEVWAAGQDRRLNYMEASVVQLSLVMDRQRIAIKGFEKAKCFHPNVHMNVERTTLDIAANIPSVRADFYHLNSLRSPVVYDDYWNISTIPNSGSPGHNFLWPTGHNFTAVKIMAENDLTTPTYSLFGSDGLLMKYIEELAAINEKPAAVKNEELIAFKKMQERERKMIIGGGVASGATGGGTERKSTKSNGQTKVGDQNGTVLNLPTITDKRSKRIDTKLLQKRSDRLCSLSTRHVVRQLEESGTNGPLEQLAQLMQLKNTGKGNQENLCWKQKEVKAINVKDGLDFDGCQLVVINVINNQIPPEVKAERRKMLEAFIERKGSKTGGGAKKAPGGSGDGGSAGDSMDSGSTKPPPTPTPNQTQSQDGKGLFEIRNDTSGNSYFLSRSTSTVVPEPTEYVDGMDGDGYSQPGDADSRMDRVERTLADLMDFVKAKSTGSN